MNTSYIELYLCCVVFPDFWTGMLVRTEAGVKQSLEKIQLDKPESNLQDSRAATASFTG